MLRKLQCTSLITFSFDDVLFFILFDTNLMYFWVNMFHFLDVTSIVLSIQKSIMNQ
jgi:hypothetical protein